MRQRQPEYPAHFVCGVECRVRWEATFTMAAEVNSKDGEVVTKASDIARFMPLLARAASAMQQHDRWPCAATIICNPSAIWRIREVRAHQLPLDVAFSGETPIVRGQMLSPDLCLALTYDTFRRTVGA